MKVDVSISTKELLCRVETDPSASTLSSRGSRLCYCQSLNLYQPCERSCPEHGINAAGPCVAVQKREISKRIGGQTQIHRHHFSGPASSVPAQVGESAEEFNPYEHSTVPPRSIHGLRGATYRPRNIRNNPCLSLIWNIRLQSFHCPCRTESIGEHTTACTLV